MVARRVAVIFAGSLLVSAAMAGCGSGDGPPDLSDPGDAARPFDLASPDLLPLPGPPDLAGIDLTGYPAPHAPLVLVDKNAGVVMSNMHLVTVTYDDDPNRPSDEAFGEFIFGSSYFQLFANEYGFGTGSAMATLHLPAPTPSTQKSADLLAQIRDAIDAGLAPPSTTPMTDNVVYAIYIRAGASVSDGTQGSSCSDYYGYHSTASYGGIPFPYIIIVDCGTGIVDVTGTASHEVIETATDPSPDDGYSLSKMLPDPWYADAGTELADMCEEENYVYEGGFALQPIWSNAAAAAGQPPCLPENDWPYYGFATSPATVPTIAAGTSVTFTITGWAFSPRKNWTVDWSVAIASDLDDTEMKPTLSATTINNGKSVTLKLSAPATAMSGAVGAVDVWSDEYQSRTIPVAFVVQ